MSLRQYRGLGLGMKKILGGQKVKLEPADHKDATTPTLPAQKKFAEINLPSNCLLFLP